MSNRRRPFPRRPPTSPDATRSDVPVTKVANPGDVVTIIPFLLGFDPAESIVVVALEGERQRFGPAARVDLVDDLIDVKQQVDFICTLIAHHGFDPVILVAYSAQADLADAVMMELLDRLGASGADLGSGRGVEVVEAVRADGSRWWSYSCHDPVCCPAEGTAYDVGSSRVAAEAVVAGLSRAASRDALRECFKPCPDQQAAVRAQLALTGLPKSLDAAAVVHRVERGLIDPEDLCVPQQAELIGAVQDIQLRDAAWMMMTQHDAAEHFALWLRLLRSAPDDLMAPIGGLAAFGAWLSGRGVLASHGAERVLAVHPEYSMARLLLELCAASVNPAVWDRRTRPAGARPTG